ncbi:hypothetical protein [Ktedonospora formicarum]|uniref:Uncharacterized protein n=1 Tax=Ktedonospora formicarum TaxID=2778364 RepID=A0A8J3I6T2_9CHLR|nr:hypothetical protein [Ktedonospora formicarum]GHO51407.1 hypothetical protein KSX_95700 [Ktedonospora formicarum]
MRRRQYPNPNQHFERHMERAAERYIDGLEHAGLQPNDILTKAMAERAAQAAKDDYIREATETRDHNIGVILDQHKQRMNMIKRRGASWRLKVCPLVAIIFGALA